MIVTTTPYIEGKHILEYKGIAATALEVKFGFDYEGNIKKAYNEAVKKLEEQAVLLGANAVVGVGFIRDGLCLEATGRAVVIE